MGEAKRKKVALENGSCLCGSSKPGNQCCFNGREWHKRAATLGLRALPAASAIEKCYMRELGSCSGGASGEHLISEAIIRLLAGDGDFTVAGLPWIPPGEFKAIGALSRERNLAAHNLEVPGRAQAAVAARQVWNASSRRARSVRREVRWRWTLKQPCFRWFSTVGLGERECL